MQYRKLFTFGILVCIVLFTAFLPGESVSAVSGATRAAALVAAFDCATVTEIPTQECQALVTLYTTTNGSGWKDQTGWLANNTPCSWAGIYCDSGHVTGIREYGNDLAGPIPVDLTKLTELTSLNLFGNALTGPIPPQLGSMTKLTMLWLGINDLSGGIPPELGNLTAMYSINFSFDNLTGPIPPQLGKLTHLQELAIDQNPLSGLMPTSLTNLPLDFFDYSYTNLCEPSDPAFQTWLAGISGLNRLNVACQMGPATYAISGAVVDNHNIPQPGVTISAGSVSAVTGSDGSYSLAGLAPGSFTLVPSKAGASFNPPTIAVTLTSASVTGQNFVVTVNAANPCQLTPFGGANGNPLMQIDPTWGSIPYGGAYKVVNGQRQFVPFYSGKAKSDNIAYWGCYLTSTAMILNYYAQKQGVAWRTDPKDLNAYLQNTDGGYSTGDAVKDKRSPNAWIVQSSLVNGWAAAAYARAHGVKVAFWGSMGPNTNETDQAFMDRIKPLLIESFCSNSQSPVIFGVTNKTKYGDFQHYIAGVGKTDTSWNVSDPLRTGPTMLADNYSNTFNQVDFFYSGDQPAYLTIKAHSPVELLLTDAQGRRAGLDPTTGQSYSEIPATNYGTITLSADDDSGATQSMKSMDLLTPAAGPYTLKVIGTGSGPYSLDIYASDPAGNGQLNTISGTAAQGKTDTYTVGLPSAPGAPPAITPAASTSVEIFLPMLRR